MSCKGIRLDIDGPDGDSLLSLDLGQHAKPRLMMSEHDFNGRVYLGVAERSREYFA